MSRFRTGMFFLALLVSGKVAGASPLNNTFARLEAGKPVQIVVVGNSVTYGAPAGEKRTTSFYWTLYDWLKEKFPGGDVRLQTSIIFAIGPELQLFRMEDKVFRYKPDLLLAEFSAANGAWGPAGREVTDPATEGYIRRLRRQLPECDVILQLGLFKSMMQWHEKKETPPTAAFLKSIAVHYDCLLGDGQQELADRIVAGTEWKTLMNDGIHPSPEGYKVHGEVLRKALDMAYAEYKKAPQPVTAHVLPEKTLNGNPWEKPLLVPASEARGADGFEAADFGRFKGLSAAKSGATLTYKPEKGRCVALLLRKPKAMGGLQVKTGDAWKDLGLEHEPVAIEEDDPQRNQIIRHFFHADGLPLCWDEISLRTRAENGQSVQIIGFLVVE